VPYHINTERLYVIRTHCTAVANWCVGRTRVWCSRVRLSGVAKHNIPATVYLAAVLAGSTCLLDLSVSKEMPLILFACKKQTVAYLESAAACPVSGRSSPRDAGSDCQHLTRAAIVKITYAWRQNCFQATSADNTAAERLATAPAWNDLEAVAGMKRAIAAQDVDITVVDIADAEAAAGGRGIRSGCSHYPSSCQSRWRVHSPDSSRDLQRAAVSRTSPAAGDVVAKARLRVQKSQCAGEVDRWWAIEKRMMSWS